MASLIFVFVEYFPSCPNAARDAGGEVGRAFLERGERRLDKKADEPGLREHPLCLARTTASFLATRS